MAAARTVAGSRTGDGGPPAVVLGGSYNAVAVARSLSRRGVEVVALGGGFAPVRRSRHCRRFVDVGTGDGVQERWLAWLVEHAPERAVVLPCSDEALELVAHHRRALERRGLHALEADDGVVLDMLDKHRTYQLAAGAGVPVPRTLLVRAGADGGAVADRIGLPCAVKPRHSHRLQRHPGQPKVTLVRGAAELCEHLRRMGALGLDVLVSEVVPGPEDSYHSYYTYLDPAGEPLVHFTKHKLRQYPVGFGLATYQVTERDPETMELGLRFLRSVGLRGLGNVEFKRDARDGRLVLIECNPRFTAAHELVRHCGLDLALLAYDRAARRPHPPLGDYRTGLHMWHPVEDCRAFLDARRAGELTLGRWLSSLAHRQHFPLADWRDPGPTLWSLGRLPARALRRRRAVLPGGRR